MNLSQIVLSGIAILLYRLFSKGKYRNEILVVVNTFFLFLLQPSTSLRSIQLILPWATILMVMGIGIGLRKEVQIKQIIKNVFLVLLGFAPYMITEWLLRNQISFLRINTNTTILSITLGIFLVFLIFAFLVRNKKWYLPLSIGWILFIFVILKQPDVSRLVSIGWRTIFQQNVELASAFDIRWIGYSYIAFRIIHVIREVQKGRYADVSLPVFYNFCLFFPSLAAGPIAKYADFEKQCNTEIWESRKTDLFEGGERLFLGLLKKFVIADSLARIALSPTNAVQITRSSWLWLSLFFYGLQIYFDFSGYTDIAIGLGRWLGIQLPENFKNPYIKTNLAKFWDSWHITLSQWIRAYYFNPTNRKIRKSKLARFQNLSLFFLQVSTMVLIGLWHGFTWTFLLWGVWHGLGLFVQNRWSALTKIWKSRLQEKKALLQISNVVSTLITVTYVMLGWVWFLSPTVGEAVYIFQRLIGAGL